MAKMIIWSVFATLLFSAVFTVVAYAEPKHSACGVAAKTKKGSSEPTTSKRAPKRVLPAVAITTTYTGEKADLVTIRDIAFHPEMAVTKEATVLPEIEEVGLARRENQVRLGGMVHHNVYRVVAGENTAEASIVASDD